MTELCFLILLWKVYHFIGPQEPHGQIQPKSRTEVFKARVMYYHLCSFLTPVGMILESTLARLGHEPATDVSVLPLHLASQLIEKIPNCNGFIREDSLHSGRRCERYHTPPQDQSSLLNRTLDGGKVWPDA